ncbi:MAG: HAMP domain-containing histidine kinase [Alphaproteobacteria bacterium]|nr:HAMP domain-containing histidine kinase [Alphaproteobacteria bacterium]MCB9692645.1 HAMP domain-containing histidine kinase [Alphaproteobacteria bacterium]
MPSELEVLRDDLALLGASTSHDLREPLQIIRLFARVLAMQPEAAEHAGHIGDAAARLAEMLDGLSRLVRLGPPEPGPARVVEVVERARRGLDLELPDPPDVTLPLGAHHLELAVHELLDNAVRHGAPPYRLDVWPDGLSVHDAGPGVPDDRRTDLLEPFHTLVSPSVRAGVGLTLADRVASRYGGGLSLHPSDLGGLEARLRVSRPSATR